MKGSPFQRGLVIVLIASLLVGGLLLCTRIMAGDAFDREEAQHGLYGLWIARDLQSGDGGSFWYDTQRQMNWPFLHSWILSIFFLVFGAGYTVARLLSLALFVAALVIIYLLANVLSADRGPKIGLLACGLALTSPLLLRFATLNMLEMLGVVLFLLAAYLYTICEGKKDLLHYVLLTFLFGLALYTNYLFAYLIVPSFIVMTISKLGPLVLEAVQVSRQGEKAALHFVWWAYRKLIVLGVVLLILGAWFSVHFSRKFSLLLNYIFKYSGGVEPQGLWAGLLYYPQVIITQLSFSPWLGLFLLTAIFMPFAARQYRGLNRLFVYVWTPLVLATLTIPAKAPQMIVIIVPFIFLIFAAVFLAGWEKLQAGNKNTLKIAAVIFLAPLLLSLPQVYRLYFPGAAPENMKHALAYFYATIPDKQANVATLLNLKNFNAETLKFHFRDWPGAVSADAQLTENDLADSRYYLTLEIEDHSPYQSELQDDSLFRWNNWLQDKEMEGTLKLLSSKRLGSAGVVAKVFEQTPR